MKRLALVLTAIVIVFGAFASPAQAHVTPPHPCFRAPCLPVTSPAPSPVAKAVVVKKHHTLPIYFGNLPQCVSTTWASKYYGVKKTQPGQDCLLPTKIVHTPGNSSNVTEYETAWAPSSWTLYGLVWDFDTHRYVGWLVQRPVR